MNRLISRPVARCPLAALVARPRGSRRVAAHPQPRRPERGGAVGVRRAGSRPSSPAVVAIVKPASGDTVTGSTVHVVLSLTGAQIVQRDDDEHPARPGPRPPVRRQRPRLDELRPRAGPAGPLRAPMSSRRSSSRPITPRSIRGSGRPRSSSPSSETGGGGLTLIAGLVVIAARAARRSARLAAAVRRRHRPGAIPLSRAASGQAGSPSSYAGSQPVHGTDEPARSSPRRRKARHRPSSSLRPGPSSLPTGVTTLDISIQPVVAPRASARGPDRGQPVSVRGQPIHRSRDVHQPGVAADRRPARARRRPRRHDRSVLGRCLADLPTQASGQPGIFARQRRRTSATSRSIARPRVGPARPRSGAPRDRAPASPVAIAILGLFFVDEPRDGRGPEPSPRPSGATARSADAAAAVAAR